MADLNTAVYNALNLDATLEALVGERIWNINRSQEEGVPALVFTRISTQNVNSASGTDGLAGVRYQLDAYANTLAQASSVIMAATAAISGSLSSISIGRRDLYEDDVRLYRVIVDVSVWGTDDDT